MIYRVEMPQAAHATFDARMVLWPNAVPIVGGVHPSLRLSAADTLTEYASRQTIAVARLMRRHKDGASYSYRRPLQWWLRRRRPFLSMDCRRVGTQLTLVALVAMDQPPVSPNV